MPPTSMPSGKLSSWKNTGKSWFLGIGINSYKEFPNLINAVRDVEKLADILVKQFDVDEPCTITLFDEQATEENILNKLDYLAAEATSNDKLIIYYSGHGLVNNNLNKGYWLPHDAKKGSSARNILNSTIQDYVGGIQAKHIFVISDACFSGSMFMRGGYRSAAFADDLEEHTSRWALCSGRHDEEVYDGDPGGHSPFAHSLLNLLSTTDKHFVPVGQLVNHVIEETASNYEQLPDGRPMFGVGHEGGQYVFRKKIVDKKHSAATSSMEKERTAQKSSGIYIESNSLSDAAGLKMVKWVAFIILGAFVIVGGIIVGVMMMSGADSTSTNQQIHVGGKTYPIINIGNQEWMATNMNSTLNNAPLYLLNNADVFTANQLGQLYTYNDAVKLCNKIPEGSWRLATAEDFHDLAMFFKIPVDSITDKGYTLPREFASAVASGGSAGLSLALGGLYYIDSKTFSPASWDNLNSGHYWLGDQRVLNLTKYGTEYTLDITSTMAWKHAYSCRCIKKK